MSRKSRVRNSPGLFFGGAVPAAVPAFAFVAFKYLLVNESKQ